ncbi:hypothetical protein [Lichenibacterium dinghuense]|uniref:hypothetical protein n=1 Tax=Lichenibacterium dinghuense TaxID=2895977 RepID=UPI001F2E26B3|nr:hypothetical protein [Lichenibacterium sp. 6Y81]
MFGHRSRGFGDEHFGALGRRFRRGPDGVLYAVDVGGDADGRAEPALAVVVQPRPACVYDRVPEPPPGYTYFSRPLRPFEVTGQPVAFSDKVPISQGSFRLCE